MTMTKFSQKTQNRTKQKIVKNFVLKIEPDNINQRIMGNISNIPTN